MKNPIEEIKTGIFSLRIIIILNQVKDIDGLELPADLPAICFLYHVVYIKYDFLDIIANSK